MPEIEGSEKREGLHLACFRDLSVESKANSLARTSKMNAKCESQVSIGQHSSCLWAAETSRNPSAWRRGK